MLINHERLMELADSRFERHAALAVSLCILAPVAFLAALYIDMEAHRTNAGEIAKGFIMGILGKRRGDGVFAAFVGGGVLLFSFLLMLQFATSRELTWHNNSVSRPLFNVVFWITLATSALLSFWLAASETTGQEIRTDGLSLLDSVVVMSPRMIPAFLVSFFVLVPILAVIILSFRLTARSCRFAVRAAGRRLRRGKLPA